MDRNPLPRKREEEAAEDYALTILDGLNHDWNALNAGIIDEFSMTALKRIKVRAWQIVESMRSSTHG